MSAIKESLNADSNFIISDVTDPTKALKFDVSAITTATTRTWTLPDINSTFVGTTITQTLTNKTINTANNTLNIATADITSGTFADARIAESNVTQHEGAINHDNLTGFVALEHLDWTGDQGANNIHQNNITEASVTQHEGAITIGNLTGAPTGTVVGTTDTQTLTNKTLTSPVVNQITTNGTEEILIFNDVGTAVNEFTISNAIASSMPTLEVTGNDATIGMKFLSKGGASYDFQPGSSSATQVRLFQSPSIAEADITLTVAASVTTDRTASFPNATGEVILDSATQTLTNKTINTASNTLTIAAGDITTGTLGIARGGTGAVTHTSDAILKGNGTGALVSSGITIDGSNIMTTPGQILGQDGTNLLPAYSFSSDPNTGMYSDGIDILNFTVGGARKLKIGSDGIIYVDNEISFDNTGSNTDPALTWTADSNTGFYRVGSGQIGITCNGTQVAEFSDTNQLEVDNIAEHTLNAGVTIDTILIKDGLVDGRDVSVDGSTLDANVAKASVVLTSTDHTNTLGTGYSYAATGGSSGRGQMTWTSGPTTLDGITLSNDDRILVHKNFLPEISDITCVADVSDSLDGTYFILYDSAGSVAFWIDVDDSGTAEPGHGAARSVEITTISTNDSASTVATKVRTVINNDSKFHAMSSGSTVNVTDFEKGERTNGSAGTSGFTVVVDQQGTKGDENGIWVRTSQNTWDRATDFDADDKVKSGVRISVQKGVMYAGSQWSLISADPITLGGASGSALDFGHLMTINSMGDIGINTAPSGEFKLHIQGDYGHNGFCIMSGESLGDIAMHISDRDDTFQILEMEADQGYITMGKTYAQTLTDNGTVYGFDIQHSGEATDFNTQNGTYRIGGVSCVIPSGGTANQVLSKIDASDYNTQWTTLTKTIRLPHTWAIAGEIKVASGDTDFLVPMYISLASGQTAKLVSCKHKINSGTSATVKVQKNDVDVTGFTGLSVTTTASTTDPADVSLADGDELSIIVTAVNGEPTNMTFTIFVEHTV